jgi:hypothetical protein
MVFQTVDHPAFDGFPGNREFQTGSGFMKRSRVESATKPANRGRGDSLRALSFALSPRQVAWNANRDADTAPFLGGWPLAGKLSCLTWSGGHRFRHNNPRSNNTASTIAPVKNTYNRMKPVRRLRSAVLSTITSAKWKVPHHRTRLIRHEHYRGRVISLR